MSVVSSRSPEWRCSMTCTRRSGHACSQSMRKRLQLGSSGMSVVKAGGLVHLLQGARRRLIC